MVLVLFEYVSDDRWRTALSGWMLQSMEIMCHSPNVYRHQPAAPGTLLFVFVQIEDLNLFRHPENKSKTPSCEEGDVSDTFFCFVSPSGCVFLFSTANKPLKKITNKIMHVLLLSPFALGVLFSEARFGRRTGFDSCCWHYWPPGTAAFRFYEEKKKGTELINRL